MYYNEKTTQIVFLGDDNVELMRHTTNINISAKLEHC